MPKMMSHEEVMKEQLEEMQKKVNDEASAPNHVPNSPGVKGADKTMTRILTCTTAKQEKEGSNLHRYLKECFFV